MHILILLLPGSMFIIAGALSLYLASPFGPTEVQIHAHAQQAVDQMVREVNDGESHPTPEKLFVALTNSYAGTDKLCQTFATGHAGEMRDIATLIIVGVVLQVGAIFYVASSQRRRYA